MKLFIFTYKTEKPAKKYENEKNYTRGISYVVLPFRNSPLKR